jgi:hypothetical protein
MPLDLSELRSELKRVSAATSQAAGGIGFLDNFVKMPESDGLVVVRILPSKSGKVRDIYQSTRIHSINGRKLHCPREFVGERWQGLCPICDYYNWLWKESRTQSKEEAIAMQTEARGLKPVERYYFNCIVRSQTGQYRNNQPNKLNTPLILSVGKQVFARILRAMLGSEEDMEPALGDVTCVNEGRDFKILKKTKKGNDGQQYPYYEDSKFLDPSPLGNPQQVGVWLAGMFDLSSLRECKNTDELKREIRIHRKVEKDPTVGFDLAELGITTGPTRQVVISELPPKVEHAPAAVVKQPAVDLDDDKSILEDDFLQKLDAADNDIG